MNRVTTDVALSRRLRLQCVLATLACALPMLPHLPAAMVALLLAGFAIGLWSTRRWPGWLRLTLTVMLVGTVMTGFSFKLGRDTASALLMVMLALKTLELATRRDCRSLLGFALFAPFAAFLQDQGPTTLLLALPALLLWLIALQQLATPVTDERSGPGVRTQLRQSAAAIGMALPLALAAFWLFPRLAAPLWGMPDNATSKTGMNDRMSPGDWLDVMNDDTPAFRVRFFGTAPPPEQMYWRGPVLSQFDGRTWSRAAWLGNLPRVDATPAGPSLSYEITLDSTERRYLFALDLPESVSVPASIGLDGSVIAREPVRNMLRYQARSTPPAAFETELRTTLRQHALALPDGYNPRTLDLARRWRAEGADDDAMVRRALAWIRGEFSYSLETPLLGRNSVDEFLFDTQIGFCEHFSSAFVVLMRAAGIPARVVTGYAGAYRNPVGAFWLVRQSDAHAWSEVWLDGRGWVRIDPTAAVAPERVFETAPQFADAGGLGVFQGAADVGDWARQGWNELLLQFNAVRQRTLLRPLGIDDASALQLGVAFTVGAGLALALTLALLLRGERRPLDPIERAWQRFQRRLARRGWPKADHEPALSYGERVAIALPDHSDALRSLSRRFANWRYAPDVMTTDAQLALVRDLSRFRPRAARAPAGAHP